MTQRVPDTPREIAERNVNVEECGEFGNESTLTICGIRITPWFDDMYGLSDEELERRVRRLRNDLRHALGKLLDDPTWRF